MIPDARHPNPLGGIAFVVMAVACFAALDTTVKIMGALVPIVMAVWFRYLFQAVFTGIVMWPSRRGRMFRTRRPGLQILRGVMLLASSMLAFISLQYLPVGEFTAIVMLTPLVITVAASVYLRDAVSPLRWVLVLLGFLGALVVIRPGGEGFTWATLLPLGLVASNAAFQILTSRLAREDDPATMHFYSGCVGVALATLLLPMAWVTPQSLGIWGGLLLLGVLGSLGHYLLILGYARAPAATLTPYLYLQIAFATLAGWLVFAHVPDAWSFAGLGLIALSGVAGTWLTAREARAAGLPVAP